MKLEDLIANPKPNDSAGQEDFPSYLLDDPNVVGFPDLEFQLEIYSYATRGVVPLNHDSLNTIPIIDIGAGRGDLVKFLQDTYGAYDAHRAGVWYYGFELNSILRTAAKKKHNLDLLDQNFLESSLTFNRGVAFCIGSLNEDYGLFNASDIDSKVRFFNDIVEKAFSSNCQSITFLLYDTTPEDTNLIDWPLDLIIKNIREQFPNFGFDVNFSEFQGLYKMTLYNQTLV